MPATGRAIDAGYARGPQDILNANLMVRDKREPISQVPGVTLDRER